MLDDATRQKNIDAEIIIQSARIRGNLYDAAERLAEDPEADISDIIAIAASQNTSLRTMVRQKRTRMRNCCDRFENGGGADALA